MLTLSVLPLLSLLLTLRVACLAGAVAPLSLLLSLVARLSLATLLARSLRIFDRAALSVLLLLRIALLTPSIGLLVLGWVTSRALLIRLSGCARALLGALITLLLLAGPTLFGDLRRPVILRCRVILLTTRVNPTAENQKQAPLRRAVADAVQSAILDAPTVDWEARRRAAGP